MDAHGLGVLLLGGAGLALVVWVLHKIGKMPVAVAETVAAVPMAFMALWSVVKGVAWLAGHSVDVVLSCRRRRKLSGSLL